MLSSYAQNKSPGMLRRDHGLEAILDRHSWRQRPRFSAGLVRGQKK
jgi:hypothetical protein